MRIFCLLMLILLNSTLYAEKLIIGTRPFVPPFEMMYDTKNNFSGFEIDLMMGICKEIEADCTFKRLPFRQLFAQVLTGQIDLAISAISITDERAQTYLFSLPYFQSSSQFLTNTNSGINVIDDVRGRRAGVEGGTLARSLIESRFNDNTVKISEYPNSQDLLQALINKKVDVILIATETARYWVTNNSSLKLLDIPIPDGLGFGIMTSPLRGALIQRINKALIKIQNDGRYIQWYNRYFAELEAELSTHAKSIVTKRNQHPTPRQHHSLEKRRS